jgi:hypothetical protein
VSLDVYLKAAEPIERECPHCGSLYEFRGEVYEANITHNLNTMAQEAGLYQALWRPDEISVKKAGELVSILRSGLDDLKVNPERFKKHNPENGWGDYDGLVRFVTNYLAACEQYPDAIVQVSR